MSYTPSSPHSTPHYPHCHPAPLASRHPTPGKYPGSGPQRVVRPPRGFGFGLRVVEMIVAVGSVAGAAVPAEEAAAPDPPPTPACEPRLLLLHPPSRSLQGASTSP
ncbi:hypothetical protein Vretimale_11822, partial [Volvox reticuliferus]